MGSTRLKPRQRGDIGELSAMEWLASKGAHIYVPIGHSPDVDLIAEVGDRLLRVEVKTCNCRNEGAIGASASLLTAGNQSWTGLVKYFEADRCDFLFVHVGDGRRWFIPSSEIEARRGLVLGGMKYSEFEIESGRPLRPNVESASKLDGSAGGAPEPESRAGL